MAMLDLLIPAINVRPWSEVIEITLLVPGPIWSAVVYNEVKA